MPIFIERAANWYNGTWGRNHADSPSLGATASPIIRKAGSGPYGAYKTPKDRGGWNLGGAAMATSLVAAPIGHNVTSYDLGSNIMHSNARTTIVVNGSGRPGATADAVANRQGQFDSDLLRNFHGAEN